MIQQLLKQLGFKEKEIAVYIAVLQKGKVAPSEVAKITDINRTTVYSVAKDLIKRGVISEDLSSPARYLVALPLDELKQEEEGKLENLTNRNEPKKIVRMKIKDMITA